MKPQTSRTETSWMLGLSSSSFEWTRALKKGLCFRSVSVLERQMLSPALERLLERCKSGTACCCSQCYWRASAADLENVSSEWQPGVPVPSSTTVTMLVNFIGDYVACVKLVLESLLKQGKGSSYLGNADLWEILPGVTQSRFTYMFEVKGEERLLTCSCSHLHCIVYTCICSPSLCVRMIFFHV